MVRRSAALQPFSERQFQVVNGLGQLGSGWLTQEQVNMLRHHNISVNAQLEAAAHVLPALNKEIERLDSCEIGLTAVTTESYKVGLSGFLQAPETAGHEMNLHCAETEVKCCPG
jgi:hypothetical protein